MKKIEIASDKFSATAIVQNDSAFNDILHEYTKKLAIDMRGDHVWLHLSQTHTTPRGKKIDISISLTRAQWDELIALAQSK